MTDLDPVSASIGGLQADVTTLMRSFDRHVQSEETDRRELMGKLDDIKSYMVKVDGIETKMAKIDPEIETIKNIRAKLAALAVFAGGVFTLLIEGVKAFGHDFMSWLNRH